jgi:uncharacterized repeat protein (TIGR02543 family)
MKTKNSHAIAKTVCLLCMVGLIVSVVPPMEASAAGTESVSISTTKVKPGQVFSVTVTDSSVPPEKATIGMTAWEFKYIDVPGDISRTSSLYNYEDYYGVYSGKVRTYSSDYYAGKQEITVTYRLMKFDYNREIWTDEEIAEGWADPHWEYITNEWGDYTEKTITKSIDVLYKIKFNANKGKVSGKKSISKYYSLSKKIGKLPTPKRKGYKFMGWYLSSYSAKYYSKESKVTSKTKVKNISTNSDTLYAAWKKKKG